ncbi:hypothetical protein C8F04DRAFT_1403567 [Mycena alexandri]|uniref:Uncharacterized protein n=1 Tax=Mycena alexandri TaxID=1745969 RepID=A0AAD6S477_9AGAR|nr:hypothetical protein C8F04DRAFT_1403567 [Mycena alexandri]
MRLSATKGPPGRPPKPASPNQQPPFTPQKLYASARLPPFVSARAHTPEECLFLLSIPVPTPRPPPTFASSSAASRTSNSSHTPPRAPTSSRRPRAHDPRAPCSFDPLFRERIIIGLSGLSASPELRLSTSHAGNPSSPLATHIAAGTLCAVLHDTNPSVHGHLTPSFSSSFFELSLRR